MELEKYYDAVYRYCFLRIRDRCTAEDLTQETFLKFLESSGYRDRGKPLAFLYTIARNLCIDHIRRTARNTSIRQAVQAEAFLPALTDTGPDAELTATSAALTQALESLEEGDRELICLRYVLELNPGEIGQIMGLSRFSVYRRLKYALGRLKGQLRKEDFQ